MEIYEVPRHMESNDLSTAVCQGDVATCPTLKKEVGMPLAIMFTHDVPVRRNLNELTEHAAHCAFFIRRQSVVAATDIAHPDIDAGLFHRVSPTRARKFQVRNAPTQRTCRERTTILKVAPQPPAE